MLQGLGQRAQAQALLERVQQQQRVLEAEFPGDAALRALAKRLPEGD